MVRYISSIFAFVILFTSGCGTTRNSSSDREHPYFQPKVSHNYGMKHDYPKTFTVYPFKNTSWVKNGAERARNNAFQVFSLLGNCAPLAETDTLAEYPFTAYDGLRVAREQGSDAVIIGEVLAQDHVWLGLYESQYVKVKLEILDTRDGKLLWRGIGSANDSDFGFVVLAFPIVDFIRHGTWSRTTMDLYHRVNIDFIHSLNPNLLPVR